MGSSGFKLAVVIILFILLAPLPSSWAVTGKYVLLTFDDGPDSRYTPEILDTLKQYDIRAMFFIVGKQGRDNPELLRRLVAEGHTIGNHTFDHGSIEKMAGEELQAQVLMTDSVVKIADGLLPLFFRPPAGHYNKNNAHALKELGKQTLLWDLGLEKSGERDPAALVARLLQRARDRRQLILLLHDGSVDGNDRTATVKALPLLIESLKEQGYVFIDPSTPEGKEFILFHGRP